MKMQQHMMRNAQQMMPQSMQSSPMQPMPMQTPQQPSAEQQKIIQIQMLTHMVSQLQ